MSFRVGNATHAEIDVCSGVKQLLPLKPSIEDLPGGFRVLLLKYCIGDSIVGSELCQLMLLIDQSDCRTTLGADGRTLCSVL